MDKAGQDALSSTDATASALSRQDEAPPGRRPVRSTTPCTSVLSGLSAERRGDSAMARTYREIAIQEMLRTVEEAMSQAINWWGDLPPPMKEAIEQFRTQLGAAIDSVEFVKKALDRRVPEPTEKATEQR